jgi:hypothetical protein
MPRGRPAAANAEGLSKMEAMRRILAEFGDDMKPLQIQEQLKTKYGIDMAPTVISSYKTTLAKKKKGKRGPGRPAKPTATNGIIAGGLTVTDIQAVKVLVKKMGAENVRALVDVLGQ